MRRGILLPLSAGPRIKRCKQTSPPFLPPAVKAPSCLRLRFGVVRVSSEGAQGGWKFGVSALPPEPRRRREGCALPGGAVRSRAGRAAPAAGTDRGPASNTAGVCRDVREGGGCGFNYL